MVSPESIGSVERMAEVKALWPDVVDLGEVQRGGNPEFWREKFPGLDQKESVSKWTDINDWTVFWNAVCPNDCFFSFFSKNAVKDEEEEPGEYDQMTFRDPGDCALKVFRCAVEGRLETENPTYALETAHGVILFWVLTRRMEGENHIPRRA